LRVHKRLEPWVTYGIMPLFALANALHEAGLSIAVAKMHEHLTIISGRALAPADIAIANWKGFVAARQSWRRLDQLFAALPVSAPRLQLPAPAQSLTVETVSVPVRVPMLAAGQLDAALGYSFRVYVDLKDRGVPVDDIVLMPMADYGLKLYGSAIIVNSKLAAEKPEVVKGFLNAFVRGLKDAIRSPAMAVDIVLKRDDLGKKEVELERLRMAIRDNIITPDVRANGFGAIDRARLEESINQIGLTTAFKAKPKADDIFDPAFMPPAADRRVN
jgi:NitT/TauT family transport system substrate-binding protein